MKLHWKLRAYANTSCSDIFIHLLFKKLDNDVHVSIDLFYKEAFL